MLKDVILVVDMKTLEWLKGQTRDEMVGFALNSCQAIADDVWDDIESWVETTRAVPSIFSMPDTWDPSKCAGVIHETKPEYEKLDIAVKTGTTGFGGKIAVALCMDGSSSKKNDTRKIEPNNAEANPDQIKWYFAKNDNKSVRQIVVNMPKEEVPPRVSSLISGGAVGRAFLEATWAATALFIDGDTPESEGPFVFSKATNAVEALRNESASLSFAFYRFDSGGVFQLFVQVDSPSVRAKIGDRYISERAFDLDSEEDIDLLKQLVSREQLEVCFVAAGAKGPCTGFYGLRTELPETVRDILNKELHDLIAYHRDLTERDIKRAISQYNRENPMEDTPVLDIQFETRKLSDMSEEDAINKIINDGISREIIHTVSTTQQQQKKISEGRGSKLEDAESKAKSDIPSEAIEIQGPDVIQQPDKGISDVEAHTEEEAKEVWRAGKLSDAQLDSIQLSREPKKGFFGIGRKAGTWIISWSRPAIVQFRYRLQSVVTVTWLKQP